MSECICSEYDKKGTSTCGIPCPVHVATCPGCNVVNGHAPKCTWQPSWCSGDDSKPKCGECLGCLREFKDVAIQAMELIRDRFLLERRYYDGEDAKRMMKFMEAIKKLQGTSGKDTTK